MTNRYAFLILTMYLAPALLIAPRVVRGDAGSELQKAVDLCSSGKRAEAVKIFQQVAESDPSYTLRALYEMGECQLNHGMLEDAITAYERALGVSARPEDQALRVQIRYRLARAYIDARLWERALQAIRELTPDLPREANSLLVKWYMRQGDCTGALAVVKDFLARNPDDPAAADYMLMKGECILCSRERTEVLALVEEFRRFLSAHPGFESNEQTRVVWPYLLQAAGESAEAVAYVRASLRSDASPAKVAANLERVVGMCIEGGMYVECIAACDELIACPGASDEQRARAQYTAGVAYIFLGESAAAQAHLQRAVEDYPQTMAAADARKRLGGGAL